MQIKILWIALIVTNLCWFIALQIVERGRMQEVSQRQTIEQQRETCQGQVGKLTDTMSKLCACGVK